MTATAPRHEPPQPTALLAPCSRVASLSVRSSRSPFGRPRTGRSDVCGRPVSRPHGLRDLRSRSAHPPTEQVLSSPHSVTSFPCEDTVRARSDKPFARLTHGYAVRLRGFPLVTLATFTKTSHDVCSWVSLRSTTLTSARRGSGRERLGPADVEDAQREVDVALGLDE